MNRTSYLRRLLAIYVSLFAVLIGAFVFDIVPNFRRGIEDGFEMGEEIAENYQTTNPKAIYMLYDLPIRKHRPTDIVSDAANVEISGYLSTLSLLIKAPADANRTPVKAAFSALGNSPAIYALTMLIALAFPAIIVLMFLIIRSVWRSLREDKPLKRNTAMMLRAIALITIAAELCSSVTAWLLARRGAELLAGSEYMVDTAFRLDYTALVVGILLLFTAEVFKIGHDLGEEQRLTI